MMQIDDLDKLVIIMAAANAVCTLFRKNIKLLDFVIRTVHCVALGVGFRIKMDVIKFTYVYCLLKSYIRFF